MAAVAPSAVAPNATTVPTPPTSSTISASAAAAAQVKDDEDLGKDVIDMEIFNQLQDMDDDEDEREFSRGIVWTYFEQVPEKFSVIESSLASQDYSTVSSTAHFLKGSSAALGVAKVTSLFEKIQVVARDVSKAPDAPESTSMKNDIDRWFTRVKKEYVIAEDWLRKEYKEDEEDDE